MLRVAPELRKISADSTGMLHAVTFRCNHSSCLGFRPGHSRMSWFRYIKHQNLATTPQQPSCEILGYQSTDYVMLRSLIDLHQHFRGTYYLHLACLAYSLTLVMEAVHSSRMAINFYHGTWDHIPEYGILP
jgi:hypothetical protein